MNITIISRLTPSISVQPETFLSCVENPLNHPHIGIRDKRTQRGRAPRDASATTCQLPPGRAISTRRSYCSTIKHLLDNFREDASTCGSRLARQTDRHVNYDTEYVFGLPCEEALPGVIPVIRTSKSSLFQDFILPHRLQQATLFTKVAKQARFGTATACTERNGWRAKAISLGNCSTESDAAW
jgi:hypothetical protein